MVRRSSLHWQSDMDKLGHRARNGELALSVREVRHWDTPWIRKSTCQEGVPQEPRLRLLNRDHVRTLPEPMSLDAVTSIEVLSPGAKVLLLMQALGLPFSI